MEEPAGSEGCPCLLVKTTEYVFNVATANGPAFHSPTTQGLRGIDAPYELKRDVWSMKRGQGIAGVEAAYNAAPSVASMDRSGGGGASAAATRSSSSPRSSSASRSRTASSPS